MKWTNFDISVLMMSRSIYLCILLTFILQTGCVAKYNRMRDVENSLQNGDYNQAAQRLERCAFFGKDMSKCGVLLEELQKSGLPLAAALEKDYKTKKEIARVNALRKSNSPWDVLQLALEIQAGTIKAEYQGEDVALIRQAFYDFGVCAHDANPACMTQYAQMILYGMDTLAIKEDKESAKTKALYWLNLAARYGDDNARRVLISLRETIPSPDLAWNV